MPEPTRCPTCGHPVTILEGGRAHWSGVPQDYATQAIPPDYRTTAPDPASVAAMRELLVSLRTQLTNLEYRANKNAAVTIRLDQPIASEWKTQINALLGPAATEDKS